jgi:hypothetical protein
MHVLASIAEMIDDRAKAAMRAYLLHDRVAQEPA